MVHNGIEYSIMQLISECYFMMHRGLDLSNDEMHHVFRSWNEGELQSFLVEITAQIFLEQDDKTKARLIDVISDKAKAKGTGKWTSQDALDKKTKEMLGLVASMVLRCDDCIKYHLGKSFEEGITTEQVYEIFAVANIVGGTIVVPHTQSSRVLGSVEIRRLIANE